MYLKKIKIVSLSLFILIFLIIFPISASGYTSSVDHNKWNINTEYFENGDTLVINSSNDFHMNLPYYDSFQMLYTGSKYINAKSNFTYFKSGIYNEVELDTKIEEYSFQSGYWKSENLVDHISCVSLYGENRSGVGKSIYEFQETDINIFSGLIRFENISSVNFTINSTEVSLAGSLIIYGDNSSFCLGILNNDENITLIDPNKSIDPIFTLYRDKWYRFLYDFCGDDSFLQIFEYNNRSLITVKTTDGGDFYRDENFLPENLVNFTGSFFTGINLSIVSLDDFSSYEKNEPILDYQSEYAWKANYLGENFTRGEIEFNVSAPIKYHKFYTFKDYMFNTHDSSSFLVILSDPMNYSKSTQIYFALTNFNGYSLLMYSYDLVNWNYMTLTSVFKLRYTFDTTGINDIFINGDKIEWNYNMSDFSQSILNSHSESDVILVRDGYCNGNFMINSIRLITDGIMPTPIFILDYSDQMKRNSTAFIEIDIVNFDSEKSGIFYQNGTRMFDIPEGYSCNNITILNAEYREIFLDIKIFAIDHSLYYNLTVNLHVYEFISGDRDENPIISWLNSNWLIIGIGIVCAVFVLVYRKNNPKNVKYIIDDPKAKTFIPYHGELPPNCKVTKKGVVCNTKKNSAIQF